MKTTKAYVLLSGGLDSTTLLYMAMEEFGAENVTAVSLYYGQRHHKELDLAKRIVKETAAGDHLQYNISQVIGMGGLSDPKSHIPDTSYDKLEGVSPTYVPFRNGLLLSVATSLAAGVLQQHYKDDDSVDFVVGYGAHAEDAANWAYPDCTPNHMVH